MVTPAAQRESVAYLEATYELSERRACQVISCCRMTIRYASKRDEDAVLRERMRSMAAERRRFEYR